MPHLAAVRRYARMLTGDDADADDLVQNTFLLGLRFWHTYRPGTDARRWLFTICRNAFLASRRRAGREVPLDEPGAEAGLPDALLLEEVPTRLLERRQLRQAIGTALAGLPEPFRLAVSIVDVEGAGYDEAAHALGVPVGTIRSRLHRGRRMLQEQLLREAEDLGLRGTRAKEGGTPT